MKSVTRTLLRGAIIAAIASGLTAGAAMAAGMTTIQKAILDSYVAAAKKADAGFAGPSTERGQALFRDKHTGGKPDTPSCTSCHTTDLTKTGKTRAGKDIEPMAASANPKRFTNAADVEKWFTRNCPDVLGRECTAAEKSDVLTYLLSQ